ncbi:GNAT family N-acetyltransferase [Azospirillum humicireducens]|uniref:GNAT family N-acetyltransferase n=1 Tax=Azospirillum humicireducens TaxID=1226968 RepID=A0A160JJ08_9PROT|nr:GNAT family N-acetyltransferase [Azospirillum humicireducens]
MACAAHWMMEQWFGGRPVPVQAVAMVAVDPTRRGAGHGKAMMRSLLMEARAAGAVLSVLCPATLPFYRGLGYGCGGVTCQWSAPPIAFAKPPSIASVLRPADPLDAAPLALLRRPLLADGNGLPDRTEALWTLALCPDGEPADLFRDDGGYIAILPPRDRRLAVADHCLPAGATLGGAMSLLAGFRAQVERVTWSGGPEDPLALIAGDGLRLDAREEWLVRPLDVVATLERRGYPAGLTESATFEIKDSLIYGNCGRYHLEVARSRGNASKIEQVVEAPASMEIGTFASLFTGHASARALWRAGLLLGEEKMINRLQRIFWCPAPWMPDRF